MKVDKYVKDVFRRLDDVVTGSIMTGGSNPNPNSNPNNGIDRYDDEYYLDIDSIPNRFLCYRHARWEKLDEWGRLTMQGVDNTITQDELDYYLKRRLRVPPEERYQDAKKHWYFHELSYLHQTVDDNGKFVDVIKEYGCGYNHTGCVPECRYYPEYGRIEDEEVIDDHKEWEERYRKRNAIVEPPSSTEMLRLAEKLFSEDGHLK